MVSLVMGTLPREQYTSCSGASMRLACHPRTMPRAATHLGIKEIAFQPSPLHLSRNLCDDFNSLNGRNHNAGNRTAVHSASFRLCRRQRFAADAAGHAREAGFSYQGEEERAIEEASGAGEMVGGGNPRPLCRRGNRDL